MNDYEECGYHCEVVGEMPAHLDIHCSFCFAILRRPQLMGCCGHHFCEPCLMKLKSASRPCPLCQTKSFDSLQDLNRERLINELKVTCVFKDGGCEWAGKLRELDNHVKDVCLFLPVTCPWNCEEKVARKLLEEHKLCLCPKRPWYTSIKDADSRSLAEKFDILSQEKKLLASDFDKLKDSLDHVQKENKVLKSEMKELRDTHSLDVQELKAKHSLDFDKLKAKHSSVDEELKELKAKHSSDVEDLKVKHLSDFEDFKTKHLSDIHELKATVASLSTALDKLTTAQSESSRKNSVVSESASCSSLSTEDLAVAPTTFTVTEVHRRRKKTTEWYSPCFLSHPQGYQLQLRVDCGGVMDGKGSHLSVFVYIAKGEQDKNLKWPFEGSVTVRLIDQEGFLHHEKVVEFPKGLSNEISGYVKEGTRAKRGHGFSQFISLEDLCSYVKDNSLSFSVSVAIIKPKGLLAGLFGSSGRNPGSC